MRTWLLGMGLCVAACGSEPPCELERGRVYEATLRELSGDCGPMDSWLETAGETPPATCRTTQHAQGGDSCGKSYTRRCTVSSGAIELVVSLTRQDDDETWAGRIDATAFAADGTSLCHSLYDATFKPL